MNESFICLLIIVGWSVLFIWFEIKVVTPMVEALISEEPQ